jgi:hypothetical protein
MMSEEPMQTAKRYRDMSPEEKRAYRAERTRARRAGQVKPRTVIINQVRGKGVATLIKEGAPDDAVGQKTVSMSVGIAKRLQNAAIASGRIDADIVQSALLAYLPTLEA